MNPFYRSPYINYGFPLMNLLIRSWMPIHQLWRSIDTAELWRSIMIDKSWSKVQVRTSTNQLWKFFIRSLTSEIRSLITRIYELVDHALLLCGAGHLLKLQMDTDIINSLTSTVELHFKWLTAYGTASSHRHTERKYTQLDKVKHDCAKGRI